MDGRFPSAFFLLLVPLQFPSTAHNVIRAPDTMMKDIAVGVRRIPAIHSIGTERGFTLLDRHCFTCTVDIRGPFRKDAMLSNPSSRFRSFTYQSHIFFLSFQAN